MGNYASTVVWGVGDEGDASAAAPMSLGELVIPVKLWSGATTPEYKSPGAAGMDLTATGDLALEPNKPTLVPTNVGLAIPWCCYGQVQGRSSIALKNIDTFPGVIDPDYRGPIGVVLTNRADSTQFVAAGDRVAQIIIIPIARPALEQVDELDATQRGEGGFGSTNAQPSAGAAGESV